MKRPGDPASERQADEDASVDDDVGDRTELLRELEDLDDDRAVDPRPKMSLRRLAARVGAEGGIVAAIDDGIRDSDSEDVDVAAIWAEVQRLYDRMVPLMDKLDRRIRQARAA
jgi:hypothetical protein